MRVRSAHEAANRFAIRVRRPAAETARYALLDIITGRPCARRG